MKRKLSNRSLCLLLVLAMLWGMLPVIGSSAEAAVSSEPLSLSILGDSISTYTGVSNDATVNSTLKGGAIYYNAGTLGVYQGDTWWQQTVDQMDLKLLVNNSWSGSCVFKERSGTVGAYLDRCVQLHNGEGEEPDIIAVYLGTNDFWTFPNSLGTAGAIDYGSLIVEGERTAYAEPATTCEAYAIMLHKMKQRYPDAEIYCFTLLPRGNQSESKVQQLQEFNASLKEIAAHFGASIVDLYNDCGIKADENFKFYVADNSLHPGPAGMDAITGCFRSSLLDNSRYWTDPVYHVSYDLNNVIVDQGTASAVSEGSSFTCSFTVPIDHILKVTAIMGGEDITDSCFADKTLTVRKVSGDLRITATSELAPDDPENFRWECQNDQMVSITERGNIENTLTMTQGSITDGKFKNVKYTLNEAIILKHDCPWILEWRSSGTWSDTTDGALLFAGNASSSVADTPYLYRRHNSDFIAFGVAVGSRYYNYGVALGANGIDATAEHTYRLENRIFEDGSNMVYLLVDEQEVGPMNHHWIGGTDQKTTVDWVNGRDFVFTNMGTSPHTIGNCTIDYIQVWENGHVHSYEKGICIGCGEEDPDYVTVPTLTLKAPTLEFKDMICVVAFFTAEDIENVEQMGMITYAEEVDVIDIQTAHHVIPGATYNEETGRYCSRSQGIHAKYLADTLYLACYAKLTDGTYVYTKLAPYSPITYATNQLKNSTDMKLKQLVVAMLNYGAAAQSYFAHKVETPANASLSAEQLALPEVYRTDMVATVPAVDESKQGSFVNNRGFSLRKPAVSFEGAFSINYFFTPAYSPQAGITLYYWTEADFCANDILTVENASGFFQMTGSGLEQYRGDLVGIAAKNLSQAIYVAAVYTDGSTTWTSGVLGYSIGAYCSGLATKGGTIADLAMATAVYGYHAKAYFG